MATNDTYIFSVALAGADWVGDDVTGHVFEAPTDVHGGGVTIVEASLVNAAATSAGTAFSIQLENWGTAGTAIKASGGTVAAALGGTASPFSAGTPAEFTISKRVP